MSWTEQLARMEVNEKFLQIMNRRDPLEEAGVHGRIKTDVKLI
jgi:hypothetical protein